MEGAKMRATCHASFGQWQVGQAAQRQAKRASKKRLCTFGREVLRKAAATWKLMLLDLTDECNQRIPTILHKVEMAGIVVS